MRTPEQVHSMLCPVCNTGLSMSERSGVEIDFCPACRGVWLDRGELDKIIERTAGDGFSRAPGSSPKSGKDSLLGMAAALIGDDEDRYQKGPRYDDRYRYAKPRKRKSLLSEFFD